MNISLVDVDVKKSYGTDSIVDSVFLRGDKIL